MVAINTDHDAVRRLSEIAAELEWDMEGASVRANSSRGCLSVEHGDYNGTHLFGFGTNRFTWVAYRKRSDDNVRLFSDKFSGDGVINYRLNNAPSPGSAKESWARLPFGMDLAIREPRLTIGDETFTHQGIYLESGMDAIIVSNIPEGGMSRSASLLLNLASSLLDVNRVQLENDFDTCTIARAAEHTFGSTCGILDQVMIEYAMEGYGTYFDPATNAVTHIPFGGDPDSFSFLVMDTGTVRPGLENARYVVRQRECRELVDLLANMGYMAADGNPVRKLAQVQASDYAEIMRKCSGGSLDTHLRRLKYVSEANQRFPKLVDAWKAGRIDAVGAIFRADGIGLRDDYELSWKQADTMCDIARTVPEVYGERMLGGGDAGAAGGLMLRTAVPEVTGRIDSAYPKAHPEYAGRYALHETRMVAGNRVLDARL
ncbi:MAG: hypothetical protein ABH879_00055 [archaeon]